MDHLPGHGRPAARAFEPRDLSGRSLPMARREWHHYVAQLVTGTGCGTLLPSACHSVGSGPDRLRAVALVTRIGPLTAHLAQARRRPGDAWPASWCHAAGGRVRRARRRRLHAHDPARRWPQSGGAALYAHAGFEPSRAFVRAGGRYPRRSTSVAPGGVIITRR
jgi:hypothetical protein